MAIRRLLGRGVRACGSLAPMRWILLCAATAASLFGQVSVGPVSIGHMHLMVADPEEQKKLWVRHHQMHMSDRNRSDRNLPEQRCSRSRAQQNPAHGR